MTQMTGAEMTGTEMTGAGMTVAGKAVADRAAPATAAQPASARHRFDSDRAIAQVALGMVGCVLPRARWTHAAHFATVLWLLRHHPELTTPEELRDLIMRYNVIIGTANTDTSGYHHTMTLASLRMARAHAARYTSGTPLHCVLADLLATPLGRSDWPLRHWRGDTLLSPRARREWVEPDLAPLPA